MALRCLVFSSHEETVQPIWQVLTDLGIEGEHCLSAVDAVERVTTQQFQIVITDWDDQPEAAFLLKTARELKAAQRPLTLAIVGDDARLPEALKAGANSVLVKPIRPEQVRDTMSTACELLRTKQQPTMPPQLVTQPTAVAAPAETPHMAAMAAAAAVSPATSVPTSLPSSAPSSVTQPLERTFRAGEFLQPQSSAPGAQFDTEREADAEASVEQAGAGEVDALTELAPMAAAVEDTPAEPPIPQEPLTGWAALQARLTKTAPPPEEAPAKSELLSYGETSSYGTAAESAAEAGKDSRKRESQTESVSEAALYAYMPGAHAESPEPAPKPRSKRGRIFLVAIAAGACVALAGVPQARLGLRTAVRGAARAGLSWLNPPPAPVPQAAPQHDSFGQSGDEYKLPAVESIPDATTDPSQVRVVPVVDPTAKPEKGTDGNGGQAQAAAADNSHADQNQAGPLQKESGRGDSSHTGEDQAGASPAKDPAVTSVAGASGNAAGAVPGEASSALPALPIAPPAQEIPPPRRTAPTVQKPTPAHAASPGTSTGIPSSLKSQIASMTPASGGNKPPEAAMSSIEPVSLPESVVRDLLTQPVDPEYPAAAKASGQRGSVVLQVLIGRDGVVRDAKFISGSLIFARASIDAARQWRFKPYSMNGRAVSVQSMITLTFKPPA